MNLRIADIVAQVAIEGTVTSTLARASTQRVVMKLISLGFDRLNVEDVLVHAINKGVIRRVGNDIEVIDRSTVLDGIEQAHRNEGRELTDKDLEMTDERNVELLTELLRQATHDEALSYMAASDNSTSEDTETAFARFLVARGVYVVVGTETTERVQPLPCFVCGYELESAGVPHYPEQPFRAVMCFTYGNYGSTMFDSITGQERLDFNVCDDCLRKRSKRTRERELSTLREKI